MAFPSEVTLPAAAAYDRGDLVGFAAATRRRLQSGPIELNAAVVSFVCVRPAWQGHGIAKGLYACLLRSLRDLEIPVITFAVPDSVGGNTLLRAYQAAGFETHSLGEYGNYAFISREDTKSGQWNVRPVEILEPLTHVVRDLARRFPGVLWSAPDQAIFTHYLRDPRPRKLLLLEDANGRPCGCSFVVLSPIRTDRGIEEVVMFDTCWLPSDEPETLRQLLHASANLWPLPGNRRVIMCPNLSGFDEMTLRSAGARRTLARFHGYLCSAHPGSGGLAQRTNLEVI
jgi:GNAT superfamily N-acetyltransferase